MADGTDALADSPRDMEALRAAVKAVKLICTDRGQHPRTTFGDMLLSSGGHVVITRSSVVGWASETTRRPMSKHSAYMWDQPRTSSVRVRCWRCGRDVQWRRERAAAIAARAIAAGLTALDISYAG